jgi:hypothetical protein
MNRGPPPAETIAGTPLASASGTVTEGVSLRWKHQRIHVGVGARQRFTFEHAGKLRVLQMSFQPRFFRALADDQE